MPLMAAYEQNDARDAARVLATMTLEGLRHDRQGESVGNAINNMYRLLQGYRSHGFYGYVDHARAEDEASMTSMTTSSDRNVGELKHALDATFESVFKGEDRGSVIDGMKLVLRMAAYPKDGDQPDPTQQERAETFFSTFLDNLEA